MCVCVCVSVCVCVYRVKTYKLDLGTMMKSN